MKKKKKGKKENNNKNTSEGQGGLSWPEAFQNAQEHLGPGQKIKNTNEHYYHVERQAGVHTWTVLRVAPNMA